MKKKEDFTRKVIIVCVLLLVLFVFSSCAAVLLQFGDVEQVTGNTAVIPVQGVIAATGDSRGDVVTADDIVGLLEDARDDDNVEAVILDINSPGGSPVGSDEIGAAVEDVRAEGKPVVAWIREVGASGAYWIASDADHIVANRMSITGSIGVTGSYFGFEEALDEWNVSYRRFVSGERKDVGSPFREMAPEERRFLQEKIDDIHEYFVLEVAENRNLSVERVEELASGEYYLGAEALEAGLIDELGGEDEALAYLESQGIEPEPFRKEIKRSVWNQLLDVQVTFESPGPATNIRT